jgi:hypothetical protein
MNHPPSFPSRRDAVVRGLVFAAAAVAWLAVMYAVDRQTSVQSTALAGQTPVVFTEAFEPNILMDLTVRGPGLVLTGEARRITRRPYEGRAVVQDHAHASGRFFGQEASLTFEIVSRWDDPGGFRTARVTVKPEITGILEKQIRARATRTGEYLVVNYDTIDDGTPTTKAFRIPEGADLSSGLMDSARVSPVFVGAAWTLQTVNLSGEVTSSKVEVVEKTQLELGGARFAAFRAVTRQETATGRFVEYNIWFDPDGRALKHVIPAGPIEIVLERRERFVPRDEDFVLTDADRQSEE